MKNIKPLSEEKKYINSNVYENEDQELRNAFLKLEEKLKSELQNPNDLKIAIWVTNYLDFVSKYEKVLDKNKLTNYMKEMFKKYDSSGNYYINLDKYINGETKEVEKRRVKIKPIPKVVEGKKQAEIRIENKTSKGLEIINIKKRNNNGNIFDTLKFDALKNQVLYNPAVKEFLEKNGYKLDIENKVLKDKDGRTISKKTIEISKAATLKQQLLELSNQDKSSYENLINNDYKKNKITSMLLNMKIVKSLKSKIKNDNNEIINDSNNIEIHKGMGKC